MYSLRKTIWKAVKVFIYGGIGAVISWLSGLPQTETVVFVTAILTAINNWLKNRD